MALQRKASAIASQQAFSFAFIRPSRRRRSNPCRRSYKTLSQMRPVTLATRRTIPVRLQPICLTRSGLMPWPGLCAGYRQNGVRTRLVSCGSSQWSQF
jgi:hypothetical protein